MGWGVGYDTRWMRFVGYQVPAICDHPDCNKEIDRGLAHVCGGQPYGGDKGCGLCFCAAHLYFGDNLCDRCFDKEGPFTPKPDSDEWVKWQATHESWSKWREENNVRSIADIRALEKKNRSQV